MLLITDESNLVHKMLAGESASWTRFMDGFAPIILKTINATIRRYANAIQQADADDVFQDVMLRLVADDGRMLRSFDAGRAALRTWLAVVARSAALDALRRRPRGEDELSDALLDRIPGTAADVPHLAFSAPLFPHPALSERQNEVMGMLFDHDLDVRDVAGLLKIGEQTVRSLKHQALSRLRAPEFSSAFGMA